MESPTKPVATKPVGGEVLAQISDGLVHLHTEFYGKGPTRAKTYLIDDTVVCLLRGGFTTVERTLIDEHRAEVVHEVRRSFQSAMEDRFRSVVEEATGQSVVAYMSQVHTNPDFAVEIFVLDSGIGAAGAQEFAIGEVDS
jgi:uncharacterized protein YbcI